MRAFSVARKRSSLASAFTLSIIFGLGVSLSACNSKSIADDVSQREANEIVAVLDKNNISSDTVKIRGGKGRYGVVVSSADFATAAQTLTRLGLPAEKRSGFDELTAGNGIIPPSNEVEALRLDRAVAVELEELFLSRGDLTKVSVIVRSHSCRSGEKPMVTVLAHRLASAQVSIESLRELAKRAVPGLSPEDVYVSLSVASAGGALGDNRIQTTELVNFLGFWKIPVGDHSGAVIAVLGLLIVTGVLASLAGYLFGQFNWLNRPNSNGLAQGERKIDGVTERRSDV
jgi:type III secretory pathway lipoprotein EscJ